MEHPWYPWMCHGPLPSMTRPWRGGHNPLERGSQPSATHVSDKFLKAKLLNMISRGYWTVLPKSSVRELFHLKISPAGVVPQRTRCLRLNIDYSYSGQNQSSLPLVPPQAMHFGCTFQRELQKIVHAHRAFSPVGMIKL